jgi:hypothetical protein
MAGWFAATDWNTNMTVRSMPTATDGHAGGHTGSFSAADRSIPMAGQWLTTFPRLRLMIMACAVVTSLAACNERQPPASPSSQPVAVTLTGFVRDTARRPVAGAGVALEAQPGSATVTGADGAFRVSGAVPGDTQIVVKATGPGYSPASSTLGFPKAGLLLPNVSLTLVPAEPLDLSGTHTLAIVAADSCGMLPSVARRRTYDAAITRYGLTSFTMTLSGARLFPDPSNLLGRTALDFVAFDLYAAFDEFDGVEIVEDLGGSSVTIWGRAVANATPADRVIDATFNGTISYCPQTTGPPVCAVTQMACTSTSHRVTLSRE